MHGLHTYLFLSEASLRDPWMVYHWYHLVKLHYCFVHEERYSHLLQFCTISVRYKECVGFYLKCSKWLFHAAKSSLDLNLPTPNIWFVENYKFFLLLNWFVYTSIITCILKCYKCVIVGPLYLNNNNISYQYIYLVNGYFFSYIFNFLLLVLDVFSMM